MKHRQVTLRFFDRDVLQQELEDAFLVLGRRFRSVPESGEVTCQGKNLLAPVHGNHVLLLLHPGDVLLDLLQVEEGLVPTSLQRGRNQAIVRIYLIVLFLCQLSFVLRCAVNLMT